VVHTYIVSTEERLSLLVYHLSFRTLAPSKLPSLSVSTQSHHAIIHLRSTRPIGSLSKGTIIDLGGPYGKGPYSPASSIDSQDEYRPYESESDTTPRSDTPFSGTGSQQSHFTTHSRRLSRSPTRRRRERRRSGASERFRWSSESSASASSASRASRALNTHQRVGRPVHTHKRDFDSPTTPGTPITGDDSRKSQLRESHMAKEAAEGYRASVWSAALSAFAKSPQPEQSCPRSPLNSPTIPINPSADNNSCRETQSKNDNDILSEPAGRHQKRPWISKLSNAGKRVVRYANSMLSRGDGQAETHDSESRQPEEGTPGSGGPLWDNNDSTSGQFNTVARGSATQFPSINGTARTYYR
jgi:hypothetical protein